jgi:hypothetical protein
VRPEEQREALYALRNSPGWGLLMEQYVGPRLNNVMADLKHESPRTPRDVSAALVRELEWVRDLPDSLIKRLGDPE